MKIFKGRGGNRCRKHDFILLLSQNNAREPYLMPTKEVAIALRNHVFQ